MTHDRSMALGPLAGMVAMIPKWIAMIVRQDQLGLAPKDGSAHEWPPARTAAEFVETLERAAEALYGPSADDGRFA